MVDNLANPKDTAAKGVKGEYSPMGAAVQGDNGVGESPCAVVAVVVLSDDGEGKDEDGGREDEDEEAKCAKEGEEDESRAVVEDEKTVSNVDAA